MNTLALPGQGERACKNRRGAEEQSSVDIFSKDDPSDRHGRQSLEVQEKGPGRGGSASQSQHQEQRSQDSAERDDCDHPRRISAPQRRLRVSKAEDGARRLADREANTRPQIEKAGQELGIARFHEQFREWGRGAEEESRRQRERNARPKCAPRRNALGHGRTLPRRREKKSGCDLAGPAEAAASRVIPLLKPRTAVRPIE